MKIKVSNIKVNPGRRGVSEIDVNELALSILDVGLLNPITLTEDYTLIAGLHRLEAVKLLGWTEIECTITDLDGLSAELAELDENFARANLSPLEMGDILKRRKDIYEALYPETKAGTAQAIGMNKAKGNNVNCNLQSTKKSFIEDTAGVTGSHPSTIARHIKIASELTPEAKEILRRAKKPVSSSTLKKISKLLPSQQEDASSLLVSGEIRTIDEYIAKQQASESGSEPAAQGQNESAAKKSYSQEQTAVIMGMAYLADGFNSHVRDFLQQEETFSTFSREDIRYIMRMVDSIDQSLRYLRNMLVNCY